MKNIILFLLLASPALSFAQEDPGCYVKTYFLIIRSTKDYNAALQTAKAASKDLAMKLDLRGLVPVKDKLVGLSLPVDTCLKYSEEETGEKDSSACYMARGRVDDGTYISIEYSTAYKEFAEGYYIVVAASGFEKDKGLMETLKKVKGKYADAYVKMSKVYMCCMH